MTRLLDILEDHLLYRGYQYCRIAGNKKRDVSES
jgi:SNF2 family DNA or RNA helicase